MNWTGMIVFSVVFGALAVVSFILFNRMNDEKDPAAGPDGGVQGVQAGSPEGGAAQKDPEVFADRPAPEFKGTTIKNADALFQRARTLFAEAEIADEGGKTEEHDRLVKDCRQRFADLHAYLETYTTWLADAKDGKWPIPSTYGALERRVARYGKLEARLPDK
jgi:hypothetical protein